MLQLVLDEHVSGKVARLLRTKSPHIAIRSFLDWDEGVHIGLPDRQMLELAYEQGLTVVTYDVRTITPIVKEWARADIHHGGVILIDERTIAQNDFNGLAKALSRFCQGQTGSDWTDRIVFLPKP